MKYRHVFALVCFIGLLPLSLSHADDCAPVNIEVWAYASYATDGETLIIQNKKFKLIGVKAPQKQRKNKFNMPGQPLAKKSQDRLNRLLANHDLRIGVQYDTRKKDTFNRGLVHLFVKQGDKIVNLNKLMIASGYALAFSEYNNNLHQKCYYQAENDARKDGIALWSLAKNQPELHFPIVNSTDVTSNDDSFRIYRGKIVKVDKSRRNYILNMDTTGIRVRREHWEHFDFNELKKLKGQTVEVRGYGKLFKGRMFVNIESPNVINVLNPVNN